MPSLATVLRRAGYATAFFHTGYLAYADTAYFLEGFETRVDTQQLARGARPWAWGGYEEQTVTALQEWLRARRGRPFFAVYSTMFPHHPYLTPGRDHPFPQGSWSGRYRNSLHYVDRNAGALLEALGPERDRTLVVVVGDHGETTSTYPVGHGLAMSPEELRLPLIVANPRLFPRALTSRVLANHLDLAPTLAAAVGAPVPPEWLGRNLLADTLPRRLLFVRLDQGQLEGAIDEGLLYVRDLRRRAGALFDTRARARFVPLAAGDPRAALAPAYADQVGRFAAWARWRHLQRARGGRVE
jgi:arylsulfatase A-like enzyme